MPSFLAVISKLNIVLHFKCLNQLEGDENFYIKFKPSKCQKSELRQLDFFFNLRLRNTEDTLSRFDISSFI